MGALDFMSVAMLVDFVLSRGAADGLGAGLGGFAVLALLAMAQAAAGAKPHASATAGKISFTHSGW
jgi:hypothetical protein